MPGRRSTGSQMGSALLRISDARQEEISVVFERVISAAFPRIVEVIGKDGEEK